MTCRELIDFLMAYTDGELSPARRAEFDRHLSICPACEAYLRSYMHAIRLGKAAFATPDDQPVPASVPQELIRAIMKARLKRG